MRDLRQTSEYTNYMRGLGWMVYGKPGNYAYIKRLPLIGNFIKFQHPEQLNNETIQQLISKYKPFQFVIEPSNLNQESRIKNLGFKQTKGYFVPSKTIQIDLTKSENQLLKEMHYKTRYNIKSRIKNHELRITVSKDIEGFADFWQKSALIQRGMYLSQKQEIVEIYKAFGKNAHIVLVSSHPEHSEGSRSEILRFTQNDILSGILMICTKDVAYYMYAASTHEGKKLFAPTINAWAAIKLAKKIKCKVFDFEGIYDERFPIKSWQGFTRFKKSFGGTEVEYPGAFQKFRFPFLNYFGV